MDAGHLEQRDAAGIAQIITGSVWYFVFLELLLGRQGGAMTEAAFVQQLARLVLADLLPPAQRSSEKTAEKAVEKTKTGKKIRKRAAR